MNKSQSDSPKKVCLILSAIWLLSSIGDRLWISVDRTPPSWDLAKHLNGSLNYWSFLENSSQILSTDWWKSLWMLSSKYPPLVYLLTAPFLTIFGRSADAALFVNLLFSAIIIASVYGIGKVLFNSQIGIWSAGICLLLPRLYTVRLQYLADYPLTALVIASFCCLTVWKCLVESNTQKGFRSNLIKSWLWIIGFGICFGLSMLVKQTTLFFLFFPIVWLAFKYVFSQRWLRVCQLIIALLVGMAICGGWYRTNWVFVLSAFGNANVTPAQLEGDPPLNTLAAWTHYWNDLPSAVSWILLLVPIVGILLSLPKVEKLLSLKSNLLWLGGYFIASYAINSAFVNKDHRYIMPYLPIVAIFLAWGLHQWRYPFRSKIEWGTICISILLMWLNLFPTGADLGNWLTQVLTPNSQYYAYMGKSWHHQELIREIIDAEPYLTANLGVLPSTPEINQHNFNYYGSLENFQVYGRQVGVRRKEVVKDARSMSWFVTKTGDRQGLSEAQSNILKLVENGADFQLQKQWDLPDNSWLRLYRTRQPFVEVKQLNRAGDRLKLDRVILPLQTPPGKPVPVTYQWSGSWEQLKSGLVILTWKNDANDRWFHDRAIGLGNLYSPTGIKPKDGFQVVERLAMFPPPSLAPGNYVLEATYLNRVTGERYPISVPNTKLEIAPQAAPTPAPELDLVTQLRLLSQGLPKGREALDPIFAEVGRINQYDPVQDYLKQAEQSLAYRLQQEPSNLEFMYTLALSQALQQRIEPLLATLRQITQLDAKNPYTYAYLSFVYLYDWRAREAENALQPAFKIDPNLVELKALGGISAIMQGNLIEGWQVYQEIKPLLK